MRPAFIDPVLYIFEECFFGEGWIRWTHNRVYHWSSYRPLTGTADLRGWIRIFTDYPRRSVSVRV